MKLSRPSSRTLVLAAAALALVLLGSVGGATAARLIDSGDIRDQSIRKQDLGPGSVGWHGELNDFTRHKISALAGQDGARGRRGQRGPRGPQGPAGDQGPAGPQGPAGEDGVDGQAGAQGPQGPAGTVSTVISRQGVTSNRTGQVQRLSAKARCEEGEHAFGGAAHVVADGNGTVLVSRPTVGSDAEAPSTPSNGTAFSGWYGLAEVPPAAMLVVHVFCGK